MINLGVLLTDSEPQAARGWYERAADAGHAGAMNNLGVLLEDSEPASRARVVRARRRRRARRRHVQPRDAAHRQRPASRARVV